MIIVYDYRLWLSFMIVVYDNNLGHEGLGHMNWGHEFGFVIDIENNGFSVYEKEPKWATDGSFQ